MPHVWTRVDPSASSWDRFAEREIAGAVAASAAVTAGSLAVPVTVSGSVQAQPVSTAGLVDVGIEVAGAVQAQAAVTAGAIEPTHAVTGAVQAQAATADGEVRNASVTAGAVQAQSATSCAAVCMRLRGVSGGVQAQAAAAASSVTLQLEPQQGLVHVQTSNVDAESNNPSTATHNLSGTGSNRLIVAIMTGQDGDANDLSSVSLGGNAGTILGSFSHEEPGERAVQLAVAYWLDADHPGSGDQVLEWEFNGGSFSSVSTVMEFRGVDQASPVSVANNSTSSNVTADNLDTAVGFTGEAGGLGIVALAGVEENNDSLSSDNQAHACTNIDSEEDDDTEFSVGRGIWLDTEVASDSQSYSLSASSDGTSELNWTAVAFALRPAS